MADHRACPGISWRESIGLTLRMPETIRFQRDGWVEVTHRTGFDDHRVFRMRSVQKWDYLPGKTRGGETQFDNARLFPRADLRLPTPRDRINPFLEMKLHTLGDVRLSSWSIRSGVISVEPTPDDYISFLLPLPNHRYPPGYSIGQGITPFTQGRVHLAIPVDIHFEDLPEGVDEVVIERETPMIQWVVAKVPKVDVTYHPLRQPRYEDVLPADAEARLTSSWATAEVLSQLRAISEAESSPSDPALVRLPSKEGDELEITISPAEARLLLAASERPVAVAAAARAGGFENPSEGRRAFGDLVAIEALAWSTEEIRSDEERRQYRIHSYHADEFEPVADDDDAYLVVVNDRNQQCLWPRSRPVKPPWRSQGFEGPKLKALEYIIQNWIDEPASFRIQRRRVSLEGDGVSPNDQLRFSPAHELKHELKTTPEGGELLAIEHGDHEIELYEPRLLPFGKKLVEQRQFTAAAAMSWAKGEPYPWETVEDMLNSLLAIEMLERV